jgi:hypothetical protein
MKKATTTNDRPTLIRVNAEYLQITLKGIHHIVRLVKIIDGEPMLARGMPVELWREPQTMEVKERINGTLGNITAHFKGWVEYEIKTQAQVYHLAVPVCKTKLRYMTRLKRTLMAHWLEDAYEPYIERRREEEA